MKTKLYRGFITILVLISFYIFNISLNLVSKPSDISFGMGIILLGIIAIFWFWVTLEIFEYFNNQE